MPRGIEDVWAGRDGASSSGLFTIAQGENSMSNAAKPLPTCTVKGKAGKVVINVSDLAAYAKKGYKRIDGGDAPTEPGIDWDSFNVDELRRALKDAEVDFAKSDDKAALIKLCQDNNATPE